MRMAVVLLMCCSGATDGAGQEMRQHQSNGTSCLALWLEAASEVHAGDSLDLILRVRNVCEVSTKIAFGGRPAHDFIVTGPDGRVVWRWLYGKVVQQVLGFRTLDPGQELGFSGEWNLRGNELGVLPPGRYQVTGVLKGDPPKEMETAPVALSLLP